ncbi:MAG TPA: DUF2628 domain-containing protein [Hyphomicrobiaceae bacterium]|nr:DUF2628 domain-containing protein [Hyphomicrobiaceae bacterium]
MQTYTVHERPNPPGDRLERAEKLEFVKEGFDWLAAALTPLWLVVQRLWLVLIAYIVIVGGLRLGLSATDADPRIWQILTVAMHLIIGLEADTLRRWTLDRNGYTQIGSVVGRTVDECERRFLDVWLPEQPSGPLPTRPLGAAAASFATTVGAERAGRATTLAGWRR